MHRPTKLLASHPCFHPGLLLAGRPPSSPSPRCACRPVPRRGFRPEPEAGGGGLGEAVVESRAGPSVGTLYRMEGGGGTLPHLPSSASPRCLMVPTPVKPNWQPIARRIWETGLQGSGPKSEPACVCVCGGRAHGGRWVPALASADCRTASSAQVPPS